jgi:hypothetical protein
MQGVTLMRLGFFTARTALCGAATYGALLSLLLLVYAIGERNDALGSGTAGVLAAASALAFYSAVAIYARRLVEARARRIWLGACAFASLAVGVLGGGPAGLLAFGPPTAILLFLAIRG